MEAFISVIIPCYNVEDYISDCVNSVIFQKQIVKEIICVDNNSDDRTPEILKKLQEQYSSVKISFEQKPGAPAARNRGLSDSTGEWIQFLDADDLVMPGKLVRQAKFISDSPSAPFIAGAYYHQDLSGLKTPEYIHTEDPFLALFKSNLGITSSNLWSRHYLKCAGGWNESLKCSQEADLMFRLLNQDENIIYDTEPMTIVREREKGQISKQKPVEKWTQYIDLRLDMLQSIRQKRPDYLKKNKTNFENALFGMIRILAEYDLDKAEEFYLSHLGKNFKPDKSLDHSSPAYLRLFKLFGFRKAEQLRNVIEKIKSYP